MVDFIIIEEVVKDYFIEEIGKVMKKGYRVVSSGQYTNENIPTEIEYWAHLSKGGDLEKILERIEKHISSLDTNFRMR